MNSELKKGQIVAVWDRDDCAKFIRIFVRTMQVGNRRELFECRLPDDATGILPVELWEHCVPLEEVEPDAFIGRERHAREQDRAVEEESKLVQGLRRQIDWLCRELGRRRSCCPPVTHCVVEKQCRVCWEEASFKATREESHA